MRRSLRKDTPPSTPQDTSRTFERKVTFDVPDKAVNGTTDESSSISEQAENIIMDVPPMLVPLEAPELTALKAKAARLEREVLIRREIHALQRELKGLKTDQRFEASTADPRHSAPGLSRQSTKSLQPPPDSWYNETPHNRNASYYLWLAPASSTRGDDTIAFDSYMAYCSTHMASTDAPPLPASLHSLAAWCSHMGDRSIDPETIEWRLRHLRSALDDRGYMDLSAFEHPWVELIIRGIKRVHFEDAHMYI